jgi:hypothetical protein
MKSVLSPSWHPRNLPLETPEPANLAVESIAEARPKELERAEAELRKVAHGSGSANLPDVARSVLEIANLLRETIRDIAFLQHDYLDRGPQSTRSN